MKLAINIAWTALATALFLIAMFCAPTRPGASEVRCGSASFYGAERQGRLMANGHPFRPEALTAAMWDVPLGSVWRVRRNGKSVDVTITDRGPARSLHRLIDLSEAAGAAIGITKANGVGKVCMARVE